MKEKITIFMLLAMSIAIIMPVITATNVVDLGVIPYGQSVSKDIASDHELDLVPIFSGVANGIAMRKIIYDPSKNTTKYLFESNAISEDWHFVNNTKIFIFQDTYSKVIYQLSINYTVYPTPKSPIYSQYAILLSNNTKLLSTLIKNNANITILKAANLNLTIKQNVTYAELLRESFNASMAQNSYNALYKKNTDANDAILRLQLSMPFLVAIAAVLSVFLSKKFGWFSIDSPHSKKLHEIKTGYGEVAKKFDTYIRRKNDEKYIKSKNDEKYSDTRRVETLQEEHPQGEMHQDEAPPHREIKLQPVIRSKSPAITAMEDDFMSKINTISKTLSDLNEKQKNIEDRQKQKENK